MKRSRVPICDILLAFDMHKPHEKTVKRFSINCDDKTVSKEENVKQKISENKVAREKENVKQKKCDDKIRDEEENAKEDKSLSAYERMVKRNIEERMAFLKSLNIDELKNDIDETAKSRKLQKQKISENRNSKKKDQGTKTIRRRL